MTWPTFLLFPVTAGFWGGSLAANGRFVIFSSLAGNLVSGDTNNTWDIFVVELGTLVGAQPTTTPTPEGVVYRNDFEEDIGPEWSSTLTDSTPAGGRRFLGQFGNDTVTLSLNDLPPHSDITVTFELFVINSWDGSGTNLNGNVVTNNGPDIWDLSVADGPTLLHTTFSNVEDYDWWQAYPNAYPGGHHPPHTGAAEIDTLGFTYFGNAVYRLSFTFPCSESFLELNFSASRLQELQDESWGLDNVECHNSRDNARQQHRTISF